MKYSEDYDGIVTSEGYGMRKNSGGITSEDYDDFVTSEGYGV